MCKLCKYINKIVKWFRMPGNSELISGAICRAASSSLDFGVLNGVNLEQQRVTGCIAGTGLAGDSGSRAMPLI